MTEVNITFYKGRQKVLGAYLKTELLRTILVRYFFASCRQRIKQFLLSIAFECFMLCHFIKINEINEICQRTVYKK